ncbi:MAG: hemin transport system permease protein [Actinomycetota bacterium]|jgi:putative ABC transport system permease protein|nr:hemin transport system permease protein [Actinomycetota bacterium]
MSLALKELRRRPGRFGVATVILTLIAILLMFLGGLLDGLTAGNTGAIRAQQADLIVYSATSQDSLVRSRIDPPERRQVEQVKGVDSVSELGSVQLGARIEGKGPRDLVPVVLFGYESASTGLPTTPTKPGEAWADDSLESEGVETGDILKIGPERSPVKVIGFVNDTRYTGQSTLWASMETWRKVQNENRSDARVAPGVSQALVVQAASGANANDLAISVDRATNDQTSSLTEDEAISALPGVESQQRVFNQIIGLTVLIAIIVVALFFALITVERIGLYGVLKALGARSGSLFAGVLLQAVIVTLIASVIGAIAALAMAAVIPPGSIPFIATGSRIAGSAFFLLLAAVIGCAFSLRRVLKVDPAQAMGAGQ